jgi:phosphoenolpyruvate carboxykinase (GTP)
MRENTIFTNTALTSDGDVWWEGLTPTPPAGLTDWCGRPWTPASGEPAAHPNSRFTSPAAQCPIIAPEWDDPSGVPISAILFGGRRATTAPLVTEAYDWEHGVFLASNVASEGTAAAESKIGEVRRDPFAMLPFCGYNMGDYFAHWLKVGAEAPEPDKLPRIFYVNWFRKDAAGKFLWPGFGDNARVLKWIVDRLEGRADERSTAIGRAPLPGDIDVSGLSLGADDMAALFQVDGEEWAAEVVRIRDHYARFGDRLPAALQRQLEGLVGRLTR